MVSEPLPGSVRDPFTALPDDTVLPDDEDRPEGGATAASGVDPNVDAGARQWWDDPSMPWQHKPTRSDIACMGWIVFMGVFGLAMLPFRAWMLARSPQVLVSLTGSRSGTAAMGALARTHQAHWWWLAMVLGSLMSIKFDWVFWWAGRLWGRGMLEVWAGQSKRSRRTYAKAEQWANRFGWVGMFVAYVPIPLPLMQVIFVLAGAERWSLKKFLGLDFLASTLWLGAYFLLGWFVGAPAVDLLKWYAKVSQYVAIALVVGIVGMAMLRGRRQRA